MKVLDKEREGLVRGSKKQESEELKVLRKRGEWELLVLCLNVHVYN